MLPKYFDSTLSAESKLLAQLAQRTGKAIQVTPAMLLAIQIIQAILIAPFINGLAAFGEEFGWRAYLPPKLMPLKGRKVMLWFTFVVGTFLGWLLIKAGSVWPAVLAHGSVNAMGVIALLLVRGQTNPLLEPAGVGLLASLPFTLLAPWLLWRSDVFSQVEETIGRPGAIPALPSG